MKHEIEKGILQSRLKALQDPNFPNKKGTYFI